jgi:hypothetical protein
LHVFEDQDDDAVLSDPFEEQAPRGEVFESVPRGDEEMCRRFMASSPGGFGLRSA